MAALRIFVSWTAGCPVGHAMAHGLKGLLPSVIQASRVELAADDFPSLERWRAKRVENDVDVVIFCVTLLSTRSAPLHFAAGKLRKINDVHVKLMLGGGLPPSLVPSPLGGFAAVNAGDEWAMAAWVQTLLGRLPADSRARQEAVERAFEAYFPAFRAAVLEAEAGAATGPDLEELIRAERDVAREPRKDAVQPKQKASIIPWYLQNREQG